MSKTTLIETLRAKRRLLLKAYVFHVLWFISSCATAATDSVEIAMPILLLLTLITVPPVLFYTVVVHKACRAVEPSASSAGVASVVFFTVFFTPFESGLVLPAKNLLVSRNILRAWDKCNQPPP